MSIRCTWASSYQTLSQCQASTKKRYVGSLLSLGSAAGVALMGQARGAYTFRSHLKWSWAVALGYAHRPRIERLHVQYAKLGHGAAAVERDAIEIIYSS